MSARSERNVDRVAVGEAGPDGTGAGLVIEQLDGRSLPPHAAVAPTTICWVVGNAAPGGS